MSEQEVLDYRWRKLSEFRNLSEDNKRILNEATSTFEVILPREKDKRNQYIQAVKEGFAYSLALQLLSDGKIYFKEENGVMQAKFVFVDISQFK